MRTNADYEYEYVAFNCLPRTGINHDSQHAWLFTQPIRVFGTGAIALQEAEQWVESTNRMRDEYRTTTGRGMDVDNLAGEKIQTEVRRCLIIRLGYERVVSVKHPSGKVVDMLDEVNKNWVPA